MVSEYIKTAELHRQAFILSKNISEKEENLRGLIQSLEQAIMYCGDNGNDVPDGLSSVLVRYKEEGILFPLIDFSGDTLNLLTNLSEKDSALAELIKQRFVLGHAWRNKESRIWDFCRQADRFENSDSVLEIIHILDSLGIDKVKRYDECTDILSYLKQFDTSRLNEIDALRFYAKDLLQAFDRIGMIRNNRPSWKKYDYILVAGGANQANFLRVLKAKNVFDHVSVNAVHMIAALSTIRHIDDAEWAVSEAFAPGADNEFDIITSCMKKIFFGEDTDLISEKILLQETSIETSKIVELGSYGESRVCVYCAPKGKPSQTRADTRDTLRFFFGQTDVPPGSNVLIVTSNIYCTRQFLASIAIENQVNLDIVGCFEDASCLKPEQIDIAAHIHELVRTLNELRQFRRDYGSFTLPESKCRINRTIL